MSLFDFLKEELIFEEFELSMLRDAGFIISNDQKTAALPETKDHVGVSKSIHKLDNGYVARTFYNTYMPVGLFEGEAYAGETNEKFDSLQSAINYFK